MTFQRTGWRLATWYLFVGFFWLLAAAIVAGFVAAWFPLNSWTVEKILFIVLAGILGFAAVRSALAMHGWIRHFETYYISLDDDGVRLRLPGVGETSLSWDEIQGVKHQKRWIESHTRMWLWLYRLDSYTIVTRRGPFVFTGMEVRRPKRAARAIAGHAGVKVEEVAPGRERQML